MKKVHSIFDERLSCHPDHRESDGERANFLMMNLVHPNLQLVTRKVWCAGRCVRIDELYEVLHIAGSVLIDAVGFGGLAAILNTNLCPIVTASFFTSRSFSWLRKQVLCCLDCLNLIVQMLFYRTLSTYVSTCEEFSAAR